MDWDQVNVLNMLLALSVIVLIVRPGTAPQPALDSVYANIDWQNVEALMNCGLSEGAV